MKAVTSAVALVGVLACMACGGPTQPSVTDRVSLVSVRYVRTRPVVAAEGTVYLNYTIPQPGDYLGRPKIGEHALKAVDDVTFADEIARTFTVPVDEECTFYVLDQAVSPYYVGTDIYVNGTRVRVRQAGNFEFGIFNVDNSGRVY
jgi:hypothetical protein